MVGSTGKAFQLDWSGLASIPGGGVGGANKKLLCTCKLRL